MQRGVVVTSWAAHRTSLGKLVISGHLAPVRAALRPEEAFLLERATGEVVEMLPGVPPWFAENLVQAGLVGLEPPAWHLSVLEGSRLGEILVFQGRVEPMALAEALRRQGAPRGPRPYRFIGEELVEMGLVRPRDVERALRFQQELRSGRSIRRSASPEQPYREAFGHALGSRSEPRAGFAVAFDALNDHVRAWMGARPDAWCGDSARACEQAAETGDPHACFEWATRLDLGLGAEPAPRLARTWYLRGARLGHGLAVGILAARERALIPYVRVLPRESPPTSLELAVLREIAIRVMDHREPLAGLSPVLHPAVGSTNAPALGGDLHREPPS